MKIQSPSSVRLLKQVVIASALLCAVGAWLLGCSSASSSSSASAGIPPGSCTFNTGDNNCTMAHDSASRIYIVHMPPQFVPNASAVIVALHPSRTSAAAWENLSGWSSYVDSLPSPQPAVIYPQSMLTAPAAESPHLAWNTFFSCSIFPQPCPNDSDFIRQVILNTQQNIHGDPKKVFVTGFSLGSMMAGRVAVEQSDLVAAVAQYEFPLTTSNGPGGPSIPTAGSNGVVSALYIDGDHGGTPNICGYSPSPATGSFQSSIDQDISYWTSAQNDNCSASSPTGNFCTGAYDSQGYGIQTSLTGKTASSCSKGTEVQAYKLIGGAHQYYCSNNSGCGPVVSFNNSVCDSTTPCNPNLNSSTGTTLNDIIWIFFSKHPKQ